MLNGITAMFAFLAKMEAWSQEAFDELKSQCPVIFKVNKSV